MEMKEFLISLRDYYGSYHHHKEQMAYAATALYLSGATVAILKGNAIVTSSKPNVVIIMFASAFLFTLLFVAWQLRKREVAADIVEACTTLLTRILAEPSANLETQSVCYKGINLPKALTDILGLNHANRKFFLSPRVSEMLTYLAIVFWSLFAWLSS